MPPMTAMRAGLLAAGLLVAILLIVRIQRGPTGSSVAGRATRVAATEARVTLPSPVADAAICTASHYDGLTHRCTLGARTMTRAEAGGAIFTVNHFRIGHADHTVLLEVDAWHPGGWPEVFGRGYAVDDALYVPLPHIVRPLAPGYYRFTVTTEWGPARPIFVTIRP